MEPSISHGTIRQSRDADFTISTDRKRRRVTKYGSQHHHTVFQLQYHPLRNVELNFQNNLASMAVSHVNSSFLCSDLISDLKSECVSVTENFISINGGFRDTSASSVICSETEEIESISTSTGNNNYNKKMPETMAVNEVSSGRKPSPATETP
ncbi:hypothetical protein QVD17_19146 [Tagetes erecta]|uniref:Uncharacterized protein n=1 Tax=Tagetes erecta TaxID=13708 RepID=A0AAD8KP58_TARER|nr:hypothetical protein QVD17_19146 [Tagetes erecta]